MFNKADEINLLSEQYKSRSQLLIEILKMYFRIFIIFAIALFAFTKAAIELQSNCVPIYKYAMLLSPSIVLSWFVGYLFLYWNYAVVITEMDCIAQEMEKSTTFKGKSLISHGKFLESYNFQIFPKIGIIKFKYLIYIFIGLPILFFYQYLINYISQPDKWVETFPLSAQQYRFLLYGIPVICIFIFHFWFNFKLRRIKENVIQ